MEALKLVLFQETACYKKPAAFKVGETYPLPPYATVKGLMHHLLQAEEYIPMRISIQGQFETRMTDYQRHYFLKKANTGEIPLTLDGLEEQVEYTSMTTMPIYMHMLFHVKLIIHIQAEHNVLVSIEEGIRQGIPMALGRWEDLVRVDYCERVQLQSLAEDHYLEQWMYVPNSVQVLSDEDDLNGVPYRLSWKYHIRKGIRQWEKIKVKCVPPNQFISGNQQGWWSDGEDCAVFPLEMEERPVCS
ncbi:type I-B CRISPR-associated protein Cas5b [Paenibacillus sp. SC116]|uniref:type I-B CRISPR-associated protein Cas5b n=1 Tax=Paenibacillus sp. SC116 TaxID=2968986 RepID=UPI00215B64E5|nr:type I-B CRISPR-associated protein Cas5b [Paenibacillus sp. SC116]MCR8844105.1 type I-B CRISPR-associated protein Cas5b [Paenibacillus sp. SC116]